MNKNDSLLEFHPDYLENIKEWDANHDALCDKVRHHKKYLPMPGEVPMHKATGKMAELQEFLRHQYDTVIRPNSVFYNWCRPTLDAIIGAIFRKPAHLKFDDNESDHVLDYLRKNADGKGNSIEQISMMGLESQYAYGRGGFLVVYPDGIKGRPNRERFMNGEPAPRLVFYSGRNIVDWSTKYVHGAEVLSYLCLSEHYVDRVNGSSTCITKKIEFWLDDDDLVLYEVQDDYNGTIDSGELIKNGKRATRIPFFLCGANNNDWSVDYAPQTPLTELNLLHYRMMSRDMHQRYQAGQIQWHIDIGDDPTSPSDTFNALNGGVVYMGTNMPVYTKGGDVKLLQAGTDNLLAQTPVELEEKAIALSANLMQQGTNETATAARMRNSGSNSRKAILAVNNEEALTMAIRELAEYLGLPSEDIHFRLNKEFEEDKLTPEQMKQFSEMVMNGMYPTTALYQLLKKYEYIDKDMTFEDFQDGLLSYDPLGGM